MNIAAGVIALLTAGIALAPAYALIGPAGVLALAGGAGAFVYVLNRHVFGE